MKKPLVAVDAAIPYLDGRLDAWCRVRKLGGKEFTAENIKDADALIIRTRAKCDRRLLEGSRVKIIASATIGVDHINLDYCREAGIRVVNAPGCNAPGVAQYVWSSLLRLGMAPGDTLGVVGAGNVGRIVADWGGRMGFRVLLNDPPRCRKEGDSGFIPLEEMLPQCDAVTIHTPLIRTGEDATFHLFDSRVLNLLRPGKILVNAARGEVTDTAALLDGILCRGLRCVIDCWEGEPEINRELLSLSHTATFHIAGYSVEGKQRASRMAMAAIGNFFGFEPDLQGLAKEYSLVGEMSPRRILDSYDPGPQTEALRADPGAFETLRAGYQLRNEP